MQIELEKIENSYSNAAAERIHKNGHDSCDSFFVQPHSVSKFLSKFFPESLPRGL